ncbi:MAG: sigma-54-dependent Fis family transcriptional regulator [Lewinellaceae bacterium]|nr:sigma-54-dependent Fis family transcriptional regulator [Saprospiraceae bacterium]MCB9338261.1 sigma-54-dependent Fis family transcriptional regulator [Lewinellaceae bacterium]
MRKDATILIVDDEEDILLTLRLFLKQHFDRVFTEHNPNLLPRLLRQYEPDVILLDMNFRKGDTSGKEGMQWLKKVIELDPTANVIMITAYGDVKVAVECLKNGAVDFVEKPWRNEKLLATIHAATRLSESKQEVKQLQSRQRIMSADIDQHYGDIVGESAPMKQIFQTIDKVAKTDANVLILGENGTGKELIARAIHRQSPRAEEAFINVDLGAIPETLFESELFGHKKGSFTDAKDDRTGRFEAASKGTLFLDEIGNLSLTMQAKLLTVLQNREIVRVGANNPTPIDIRLVCATNQPIYDMVRDKTFRQDLLYRINTVALTLPPLRDRVTDIPLLANHFLSVYARKYQKPSLKIAPDTMKKLQAYNWPGNIRELRHTVERAVILGDGDLLQPDDFMLQNLIQQEGMDQSLDSYNLDDLEKWAIQKAMTRHQGNITKAAEELGLTRAALYRRLEKYGL